MDLELVIYRYRFINYSKCTTLVRKTDNIGVYECVSIGYTGNHYASLEAQFCYEPKTTLKTHFLIGMMVYTCNPTLRRLRQDDCLEFEVGLGDTVSWRSVCTTQWDLVSKNKYPRITLKLFIFWNRKVLCKKTHWDDSTYSNARLLRVKSQFTAFLAVWPCRNKPLKCC